jgi:putative sugar O-methyltransferase
VLVVIGDSSLIAYIQAITGRDRRGSVTYTSFFWEPSGNSMNRTEHERTCAAMMESVLSGPELLRPSKFWQRLVNTNLAMIATHGIDNFKRTVAQNYYNWLVTNPFDPQFRRALVSASCIGLARAIQTKCYPTTLWTSEHVDQGINLSWLQRRVYSLFVGMIWSDAMGTSTYRRNKIQEPLIGNPIPVFFNSSIVSQDLSNSIFETTCLFNNMMIGAERRPRILELGGGYGRLAYVTIHNEARHYIVDIPPALDIAQWYLPQVIGSHKRVFHWRQFDVFDSIRDELEQSDVGFFTPAQLSLFPDNWCDAFVSISTLPEMTSAQIEWYLTQMMRISRDTVYLKQWRRWRNQMDGTCAPERGYRLGAGWHETLLQADLIQPNFVNQVWRRSNV